eukprot:TRINITY_DN587_c0_g1_i2.p1 TRINITY_DN587_c0_g1~~TRINITY_DN587_c0_g1_i2.p1  ORF type:complete len:162 (+),score=27.59 TRINITY_DN587_c0_g1_i2:1115-1600(+)
MMLPEYDNEPQWSAVGDTYPVGCEYSESVVHYDFFQYNPDFNHELYSTKFGVYLPHCGLKNVKFSYGHDEFMYLVLKNSGCTIPQVGLDIIRLHSFYAWHSHDAYDHLMEASDVELKKWVKKFNKCDLYTKHEENPDVESLKPYYQGLIDKYFPNQNLVWG